MRKLLAQRDVTLLSAGLEEVPGVSNDIDEVLAAQTDLVTSGPLRSETGEDVPQRRARGELTRGPRPVEIF